MRRSSIAATVVLMAVLAVTGCAAPSPEPTQSVSAAPVATPTPTPEVLLVAGGERPPTVFGGDCAAVISLAELSGAVGYEVAALVPRDERWTRAINNAGGLSCEWEGGRVDVIPRVGLKDAALSPDSFSYYFEECDWACAWEWQDESLWVTGTDWATAGRTREEADAIGALVGRAIAARWSASVDASWDRDRNEWWPAFACDQVATAVGDRLAAALTGAEESYIDPAGAGTEMSDAAMHRTSCALSDDAGLHLTTVVTEAGVAWDAPWWENAEPIDLGVAGLTAYVAPDTSLHSEGKEYEVTDGMNLASIYVPAATTRWSQQQIATAIATAAASGFQR